MTIEECKLMLKNGSWRCCRESTYLKVTMEGVGIGRKIDLSLHRSLPSLMYTLVNMFGLCKLHDISIQTFTFLFTSYTSKIQRRRKNQKPKTFLNFAGLSLEQAMKNPKT